MSGLRFQGGEGLGAALGREDLGVAPFEKGRQGEDVAEVVVDDEDLHAAEIRSVGLAGVDVDGAGAA